MTNVITDFRAVTFFLRHHEAGKLRNKSLSLLGMIFSIIFVAGGNCAEIKSRQEDDIKWINFLCLRRADSETGTSFSEPRFSLLKIYMNSLADLQDERLTNQNVQP